MTESLVKQLQAENDRLKRRLKTLERRLAKFRKKNSDLAEEIEELDIEAEVKTILNSQVKLEDRCPKCNRELDIHPLPFGEMFVCSAQNCNYTKTEIRRKK